jgi:hypothetical protein
MLPGFSAASLDGQVFLSAKRAEISLPWSTITGDEPVITRVQLDSPVLDLAGMQRWLASRPPTPFKLPTLSRGLVVTDGTVMDARWSLRKLFLGLPHLQAGDVAKLDARGEFAGKTEALPFVLTAIASTPGLESDLDLKLRLVPSAGPSAKAAPISIALVGRYAWAAPRFALAAKRFALVASSPIPSLDGSGKLELSGQAASLGVDAVLSRWPEAWPTLPAALAAKSEQLPVHLEYRGKPDFSDVLSLRAARDDTELQASLRVPELQQWLAVEHASPLPPLRATLKTPSLDFNGIELQGVEVEIGDGGSEKAAP